MISDKELEAKLDEFRDKYFEGYSRLTRASISTSMGIEAGWYAAIKLMEDREAFLIEELKLLGTHMGECECYCMDHIGLLKTALKKHKAKADG